MNYERLNGKLSNLGNRVWYGDSFLPDYDLLQYYHRLFTSLPLFRFPKRNNISNRAWNGYLITRPRIFCPSTRTVRVQVLPGLFIGKNIQIVMLKKFCHGQNVTNGGIKLQQKLNAWSRRSFQLISSIVEILNSGKIIKPWSTSGNHFSINRILTLKQFHQSLTHRTNPKMLRNTGCKYFDNLSLNKWPHRCWWRMLETKCVGDNFEMLVMVSDVFVTNILYL